MANVRKILHPTGKAAWRATVKTIKGTRKSKNHATKREADAWVKKHDGAGANGSADMTVLALAKSHNKWFDSIVAAGERDQRTADGYDGHLRNHLEADVPAVDANFEPLPTTVLSELDTPRIQAFLDRVIARTGSVETARRVRRSLSAWCAHGARNGWLKGDPVKAAKIVQKRRRRADQRVEVPPKAQLSAVIKAAAEGPCAERDTAIIHLLMFGGFRISELLGAADEAADLKRATGVSSGGVMHIVETLCSRHTTLGDVKSDDGLRDVPMGPATARSVRAWRAARGVVQALPAQGHKIPPRLFPAPPGLRFGQLWSYSDFRRLCWNPLMVRAGLTEIGRGQNNRKLLQVAFSPHMLRHVYASIQIENGVTPKRLQALLGHATLAMTMDLYGHLWTDAEGDQALAAAGERAIMGRS